MSKNKNLVILVAGPYCAGTSDDPVLMEQNLRKQESAALQLFKAGHIPVISEWLAMPLVKIAGSKCPQGGVSSDFLYPVTARIIRKCDAILRLDGPSKVADNEVLMAKAVGIAVFYDITDILNLRHSPKECAAIPAL